MCHYNGCVIMMEEKVIFGELVCWVWSLEGNTTDLNTSAVPLSPAESNCMVMNDLVNRKNLKKCQELSNLLCI